jgi:hypothetical protein
VRYLVNNLGLRPWYLWSATEVPRNLNVTKDKAVSAILNYTDTTFNAAAGSAASSALLLLSAALSVLLAALL